MVSTSSQADKGRLEGDFRTILIEERDDRLHVQLNLPESRNAIGQLMIDELHAVCAWLENHPKVLIVSGSSIEDPKSGKRRGFFASGADISQLKERRRDDALRGVNSGAFDRIHKLPMPVIAALDGFVLGGGAELAYAADFRIGTPHIKIGQPEANLGIVAAAGALWRLKELVGEAVAVNILMGGKVLNADEALSLNLVTEIHEPDELINAAHSLADRITAQDPLAIRLSKSLLNMPREAHPYVDNIAQSVLFESPAKFERMDAFLNRRK